MSSTNIYHLPDPFPFVSQNPPGIFAITLNSTGYKAACMFFAPKTGNVRKLLFGTRTVTTGGTFDIRLETVSLTDGNPTGTLFATNSNGSQALVATTDNNTLFATQMTADAAVTQGQLLAIVVVAPASVNVGIAHWYPENFNPSNQRTPYVSQFTSAWSKLPGWLLGGLEYDDGSVAFAAGQPFPIKTTATASVSSSTTPDERGFYFSRPFADKVTGFWFQGIRSGDVDIVLYDASNNVVATNSFDKDTNQSTGAGGFHFLPFATAITLTANTYYRCVIKPTTTTAITVYDFDILTAAHMDAFQGGQQMIHTQRTDAGSWTNNSTKRLIAGMAFERVADAASGGLITARSNAGLSNMSRNTIVAGSTSQSVGFFAQDTSSSTGAGLALTYNAAGLAAKFRRQGSSSWTTITLATMTLGTWVSGGLVADSSGVTGGCELGLPNAAIADEAGVTWVEVVVYGATNLLPVLITIQLDKVNYQDATRMGLTALPNAAAEASGGLITRGTGAGQLNVTSGKVAVPDDQKVDLNTIKTQDVTCSGGVTIPAATLASTTNITSATGVTVATNNDKTGYQISGTLTTLDELNTQLATTHGAGSWATATGFSTHSAADVWTATGRTLSTFGFTVDTNANATETAIKAVADKLDTALVADGLVYQFTANALELGPSGGSGSTTVIVQPASTEINERVVANTITAYYGETGWTIGPNAVVDGDLDPVDLSVYDTLVFTVENQWGADVFSTESVSVSGTDDNQWSVVGTSAITATAAKLAWSLRGKSTNVEILLGLGELIVVNAARKDA